jgi:hypothetical protein
MYQFSRSFRNHSDTDRTTDFTDSFASGVDITQGDMGKKQYREYTAYDSYGKFELLKVHGLAIEVVDNREKNKSTYKHCCSLVEDFFWSTTFEFSEIV